MRPFIEKIDPTTIQMHRGEEAGSRGMSAPAGSTPVGRLRNLGPASARMLESIGIASRADLERVGPVLAYRALKDIRSDISLNLLWAMHGALTGERWDQLSEETRKQLKLEVQEALQVPPGRTAK